MSVKQERFDDAEINEMAAKFKEVHKVKQASAAQHSSLANMRTQNNILNYFNKTNGKRKADGTPVTETLDKSGVIDERSLKGQFGWTTLGDVHIPYIFRGTEDKYSAVRIIEMKVLNKHLRFLHQDIYNCTCIRSYYITESEARLLNEINFIHCDSLFGSSRFTGEDLIVRLSDAVEFYKFLDACSVKLLTGSSDPLDRCGFIRINQESVVPYTIYQEEKFVPLFYFEGETDNLKKRANKLEGWDLSYLKFCCKVQGIRNELFAHDSCSVISLNDIKNYFPPGTTFEDYWPRMDTQYLLSNKASNQTQVGQWTRQPVGPPIAAASHLQHMKPAPAQPKAAPTINQIHNVQNMYNNFPMGAQSYQPPRTLTSTSRTNYATNSRQSRPYNYPPAPPPPLVRPGPTTPFPNSQSMSNSGYLLLGDGYNRAQAPIHKYPPALIPVRQVNGGLRYENSLYQPELGDLGCVESQDDPLDLSCKTQTDEMQGEPPVHPHVINNQEQNTTIESNLITKQENNSYEPSAISPGPYYKIENPFLNTFLEPVENLPTTSTNQENELGDAYFENQSPDYDNFSSSYEPQVIGKFLSISINVGTGSASIGFGDIIPEEVNLPYAPVSHDRDIWDNPQSMQEVVSNPEENNVSYGCSDGQSDEPSSETVDGSPEFDKN